LGECFPHANEVAANQGNVREDCRVIFLWIRGGLSQLESFDPAYNAPIDIRGEHTPIEAGEAGSRYFLSNRLPQLRTMASSFAIVRGMNTEQSDHARATRNVLKHRGERTLALQLAGNGAGIPYAIIKIPSELTPEYMPGHDHGIADMRVDQFDPATRAYAVPIPTADPRNRLEVRRPLLSVVDTHMLPPQMEQRHGIIRQRVFELLQGGGVLRAAFVPPVDELRQFQQDSELFGESSIGSALHLAVRLAERGVDFTTVHHGEGNSGWDHHSRIREYIDPKLAVLDVAVSGLLRYLRQRRQSNILFVLASEFGRTAEINGHAGRDHNPDATCALLAGSGIRGGRVVGATNPISGETTAHVTLDSFLATIARAAGKHVPANRPVLNQILA
jgi:hypothetical protein